MRATHAGVRTEMNGVAASSLSSLLSAQKPRSRETEWSEKPVSGAACLLDAGQAGTLLGVPASWLLAQARRDAIPHVRLGKYVRFDEVDLLAWLETVKGWPK
jgi:Helix-turn-helix domain